MRAFLRRVRSAGFDLVLLAGLTLVAAVLVVAAPRLGNHNADRALRQDLAATPYAGRDLLVRSGGLPIGMPAGSLSGPDIAGTLSSNLAGIYGNLPDALQAVVGDRWGAATVPGDSVSFAAPSGSEALLSLRTETEVETAGRVT